MAWGRSSAGRAPALQAGGRRFDPVRLHHLGYHGEECVLLPICLKRGGLSGFRDRACCLCLLQSAGGGGVACVSSCLRTGCACCSLLIVNQVLVRLCMRRTPRMALAACTYGAGWFEVVRGCPWLCWHGCLTQGMSLQDDVTDCWCGCSVQRRLYVC